MISKLVNYLIIIGQFFFFMKYDKVWLQTWLTTTSTKKKKIKMATYFENVTIGFQFFMFLTRMSNFMLVGCYLLFNPQTYFFMHNFRV